MIYFTQSQLLLAKTNEHRTTSLKKGSNGSRQRLLQIVAGKVAVFVAFKRHPHGRKSVAFLRKLLRGICRKETQKIITFPKTILKIFHRKNNTVILARFSRENNDYNNRYLK